MRLRLPRALTGRIGAKLNFSLLLFMALLAIATAAIVYAGFRRTQDHATARSRQGLEAEGSAQLLEMAGVQSFIGQVQMAGAADLGQQAAALMFDARSVRAEASWNSTTLVRRAEGQWYDPRPDRHTDVLTFPAPVLTTEMARDLRDSAVLDDLLPPLVGRPSQLPDHQNFEAVAIYYIGPSGSMRSYPPAATPDRVPAITLDAIRALMTEIGPVENPVRRPLWTDIHADDFGRGDVLTAYTPVYDATTFRGVIGVDLAVERLIEQVDLIRPSPTGFAFYVGSNGAFMRTAGAARVRAALDVPGDEALTRVYRSMQAGGGGITRAVIDGQDVYVAYAPFGAIGGALALVAPIDELTAPAAEVTASINREGERTVAVVVLAMGALFAVALAGTALLNRRMLLRPIAALLSGTRAVTAGDLATTIPVQSGDELGMLAGSFNLMTAELRETEGRYKSVFDSTHDALMISRLDGRTVDANPAACAMHGYSYEEMLALDPGAYIAADCRAERRAALSEVEAGRPYRVRSRDLRKDGTTFDVEVSGSGFSYRGELHVLVVMRDITEELRAQQLLEERVAERTRELRTLLDVSRDVASTLDLQPLAGRVLDALRGLVPYSGAGILAFEDDHARMLEERRPAGTGDGPNAGRVYALPGVAFVRRALRERAPAIVADVRLDANAAAWQYGDEIDGPAREARAWLAVPLVAQDRVAGLLMVWSTEPNAYTDHHAELAMAVGSQAAIAIENARLYQQAAGLAALEERQRLARELHDSVSQSLYGIALGAHTARALLDSDPPRAAEPVNYVLSLAEAGLTEMRALIFELRPESLEAEGLVAALQKQVAATRARYGLVTEAELGEEPDAPLPVKEALYRIAQEALHNTIKHARATRIDVRLATAGHAIELTVRDDGRGFDPAGEFPGHLGLHSMRERAAAAGGTIEVESTPGAGTTVRTRFPLAS